MIVLSEQSVSMQCLDNAKVDYQFFSCDEMVNAERFFSCSKVQEQEISSWHFEILEIIDDLISNIDDVLIESDRDDWKHNTEKHLKKSKKSS